MSALAMTHAANDAAPLDMASDPSPAWARENPDDLLRFLYVSPRPCAALDELLGLTERPRLTATA
ncbi:hypothetical protein [Phenylobacterium sp.]|uniref:hypothetical protein n=1 Tax=Phenylobacterium sp. TaxID=1871053 RepID=UPI00273712B7|nr:hypothetical protein [Phenylobacterium sp.]MDP3660364.1 hypothetical protein [Phenylobacterium sp.]